jgi:hypothetical protein
MSMIIDETTSPREWVGTAPSSLQIVAILLVGTVGMLICGVQPVLLGAMVVEHRLTSAGLGWATTAEFLTLGIGIIIAGWLCKPRNLRFYAVAAALVTGIADLAVQSESGAMILINRAVSGGGEAILVWIAGCMIARSATPARWAGVFLTLQGISQLAFAALMPLTLMASHGANGGFSGMAITALLAVLAAPFLPSAMADLPASERSRAEVLRSPSSIMVLICVFLISAFSIGLFAYIAPISIQAKLSSSQLGFVVSVILGSSIAGSGVAALVPKLPYYPIFAVCLVVNAITLAILWALPSFPVFLLVATVFGFSWLFFLPFQLPMAIEADPTRQIAVVLGGAQLLGAGAGPFLCSFFVTDSEARGSLIVVGLCFLTAFLISSLLRLRVRLERHRPALGAMQ